MTPRMRLQPETMGSGLTSQRVRDRLVERLRANGIADERVLEAVRLVPRHLFVDEALATRAYEDTALDRKSTRLNSSHVKNSYAVCCLKKKSRGDEKKD